ncbi:phage portal protein [Levilactobacillus bambusae]|nr:phage portal protein [Levilactobacillus bambusae]
MGLKVDASLIEDIDNPPYELLNYALNELDRKREKYDKLYSYYCGKQGILSRMLGTPYSQDKDSHVVVNHAKYFTDMITGMMTGNPITYVPQEGNSIEAITEAFNHMNVMAHDMIRI